MTGETPEIKGPEISETEQSFVAQIAPVFLSLGGFEAFMKMKNDNSNNIIITMIIDH
jgi:hypothetical protein